MGLFSSFTKFLSGLRPRPFKRLQRALDIEEEWSAFKENIRPHKFKLFLLAGVLSFPLYRDSLAQLRDGFYLWLGRRLERGQPAPQLAEAFAKQLLSDVFQSAEVKKDAGQFVSELAKRQAVLDAVLELLLSALRNPLFLDETKVLGKDLIQNVIADREVTGDVLELLLHVLRDPEFKDELQLLAQWLFTQEETKKALAQLLAQSFTDEQVKTALAQAIIYSLHALLIDKQSVEKIRTFTYFLLRNEDQSGKVKNLIDLIVERSVKKKIRHAKESDFESIFKRENQNLQQMHDRMEARGDDVETDGPAFRDAQ